MSLTTMYPAKNNSPKTTLTTAITAEDTALIVADASVLPAAPNLLVLGTGDDAEIVSYTAISGNVVSGLTRGVKGTTKGAWPVDTIVARNFTAYDADAFRENILDLEDRKANKTDLGTLAAVDDATDDGNVYGRKEEGWYNLDNRYYTESEINALLADKAPLDSPEFSGTPKAPTAAKGTNTTQLATTAFVLAHVGYFSSLVTHNAIADFHNANPRYKDITSYFTDGSLWNRINGTGGYSLFEDLFVGDYLTVGGQTYIIVDFDYYIRCGNVDPQYHHAVLMPIGSMSIPAGTVLYGGSATLTLLDGESATSKKWNPSHDTKGGYKYSRMRQTIMKAADTIVVNAFGASHVKIIDPLYPNPSSATASGLAENWTWFNDTSWSSDLRRSICDLPNETQVYGQQVWGRGSVYTNMGYEVGVDKFQFSLFRVNRDKINIRAHWWLRSVLSSTNVASVSNAGSAHNNGAGSAGGVRPRFLIS